MSAYSIDFSDPLKNGFSIPAGGFNGPGGSSANTSLRLYGRGALEWGEAVDEDLVRLTENFASASPPSVAVAGQLWMDVTYYYHNDSLGVLAGWYFYDLNSVAANKWTLLNGTGVITSVAPLTPVIGQYYYVPGGSDTSTHPTGTLNGFYSLGRYEPAAWVARSYLTGTGAPVSPALVPTTTLRVRDAAAGAWSQPSTTTVTTGATPTAPVQGQLWYNSTTGNLLVYTGSAWQEILGPQLTNASTTSGIVDMAGFRITNLGTPTASSDATTKAYVDGVVGGVGGFLSLSGGTISGSLVITGNLNVSGTSTLNVLNVGGAASVGTTLTVGGVVGAGGFSTGGNVSGASLTISGAGTIGTSLSVGNTLNMNNTKVINLATGTNANDAVNVAQMNAAVAAAGVGASTPVIYTSGTYKAGDIAIASGKVYIAIGAGTGAPPGGNWRQVYPAVYA